jgi:hypothetical protein
MLNIVSARNTKKRQTEKNLEKCINYAEEKCGHHFVSKSRIPQEILDLLNLLSQEL